MAVVSESIVPPKLLSYQGKLGPRWTINIDNHPAHTSCQVHLHIGIEGGGTNTRIRITRPLHDSSTEASILYRDEIAKGSNLYRMPEQATQAVRQLIDNGINQLFMQFGWIPDNVCYDLALGMAGTEGYENAYFLGKLSEDPRMQKVILASDAEVAWLSVFDTEGVIIIAGTGGVRLGRNSNGDFFRKSGFSVPLSDRPSAASFAVHYGQCIDQEVSYINGKATWRDSIRLGYMKLLLANNLTNNLANNKSHKDTDAFFDQGRLVINDLTAFAAQTAVIKKYYDDQPAITVPWSGCSDQPIKNRKMEQCTKHPMEGSANGYGSKDYCAYQAMLASAQDLADAINIMPPGFVHLPFAIHGTFGNILWNRMIELLGYQVINDISRKNEKPVDPLAGALKMLQEPMPDSFNE